MAQYEVGEVSEAPRGSTSSAMPHKRNPVHLMQAVAQAPAVPQFASLLLGCMAQAPERALGEWQAGGAPWAHPWRPGEWERGGEGKRGRLGGGRIIKKKKKV